MEPLFFEFLDSGRNRCQSPTKSERFSRDTVYSRERTQPTPDKLSPADKEPIVTKRLFLSVIALAISLPVIAGDRILLPLYTPQPIPGALGSQWETKLTVFNPSLDTYAIEVCSDPRPDAVCEAGPSYPDLFVTPGEIQTRLPGDYPVKSGLTGYVLYFKRTQGTGAETPLAVQLRARDLSRNASSAGTEIPVIRESDFREGATHLLSVPTDPRFRALLRVYEMNLDSASFRIRVFDEASGEMLREATITLETPPQGPFRFQPGYYQSAELLAPPAAGSGALLRVQIEPLTSGSRSWAFVSITNNITQEFTLITP